MAVTSAPSVTLAVVLLIGALAAPAWGAIYVKIDGVEGGVTEASHKGWIEAERYACVASAPTSPVRRRDFSFTKTPDAVSEKLQEFAAKGAALGTVQVHVTAPVAGVPQAATETPAGTLLEYELQNAKIDPRRSESISVGGNVLYLVVLEAENIIWAAPDGSSGDGCH